MNKPILIVVLVVLLCGCFIPSPAQLLDSAGLANAKTYISIEEALSAPDSVVKLVLRKQKLKEFPSEIFKFTRLQYLDLGKNKIKEIPKKIDTLQNLQVLNLSYNSIESIPIEITHLSNLKHLDLGQNQISLLPTQIGNLQKLEIFDLWSNNIVVFPEEIKNLKNLKFLDLRVILMNQEDQDNIRALLPNTNIKFDPSCHCKY